MIISHKIRACAETDFSLQYFHVRALIHTLARKEVTEMYAIRGQGLVEYALIMVLVAMVVMILLFLFGGSVGNVFSNIMYSI